MNSITGLEIGEYLLLRGIMIQWRLGNLSDKDALIEIQKLITEHES